MSDDGSGGQIIGKYRAPINPQALTGEEAFRHDEGMNKRQYDLMTKASREAREAREAVAGLMCYCAHCPDWRGTLADQKKHMRDVHGIDRRSKNLNRGGFKKREAHRAQE